MASDGTVGPCLMFWGATILFIPLLAAFLFERRLDLPGATMRLRVLTFAGLAGVGVVASFPFLTSRGVGTGEAANYRLALADGVTQLRAGHVPLVGQTEFAFNGRVHPLRNAPYLFYLAAALDALSWHRLTFWELQNLSLAFSLVAAVLTCYLSLRWATGVGRPVAVVLATIYGWSPALLAAGTINLFMTVHAAVFVPIAFGAVVCQSRRPSLQVDFIFAAALAATWLAHPPVAVWTTLAAGLARLFILWGNPSWRARWGLVAAGLLSALLASFVFVSVVTLSSSLGYFPDDAVVRSTVLRAILANVDLAFPGALLPISRRAALLNDLQFGYVNWFLLFAGATALVAGTNRRRWSPRLHERAAAWGLLTGAILLLVLVLPIPGLTSNLWAAVPLWIETMTSVWPMQRLYLVATAAVIFLAAICWNERFETRKKPPAWLLMVASLLGIWTTIEAVSFLRGGMALRWTAEQTRRSEAGSNIDLTVTSYAFFPLPPSFVNGVADPLFEFSLVDREGHEVTSPLAAALRNAPIIARGEALIVNDPAPLRMRSDPIFLRPGKKYVLDFDFVAGPFVGTLEIFGPTLTRNYALPSSGESHGFGIGETHRHAVTVETSTPGGEKIDVRLSGTAWPRPVDPAGTIATFTVREVDPATLPVIVKSWFPLRCEVDSPGDDYSLVTPRGYIEGYTVAVNGRRKRAADSPTGQVMIAVPRGKSMVEIKYPGPFFLRAAFWVTAISWLGFFSFSFSPRPSRQLAWLWQQPTFSITRRILWRYKVVLTLAVMAIGFALFTVQRRRIYLESFGPLRVRFVLPRRETGRSQPLVVTGKTGRGTNVFVTYIDDHTVRIGADVWGTLLESPPLPTDFGQEQELILNSSGLYPLDHPGVVALSAATRDRAREEFTVEFNGAVVLQEKRFAYESTVEEVTVGKTLIGGSLTQPTFAGEIIAVDRLPVPQRLVVAEAETLEIQSIFPSDAAGRREALFSMGYNGSDGLVALEYLDKNRVRLTQRDPGGAVRAAAEIPAVPGRIIVLDFTFGGTSDDASVFPAVTATLAGRPILGDDRKKGLPRPIAISVGEARQVFKGIEPRFTGPKLAAKLLGRTEKTVNVRGTGVARLVIDFPSDKPGRAEPLLTTGKTGAGDFAYVVYVDRTHAKFAVDHWGVGGAVGPVVPMDYRIPHEIEIQTGALLSQTSPSPAGSSPVAWRDTPGEGLRILLDGKEVVFGKFTAYPTTSAQITPGENRIGGSGCDATFTGEIEQVTTESQPQ